MLESRTAPDHQGGADEAAPARDNLRPDIPRAIDDNRLAITFFQSASVILSLALHAGAAAAFLVWFEPKPGAISAPTEAITIELIASEVIEAAEPAASTATAAANAPDAQAGSTHEAPAREEQDTPEPPAESPPQRTEHETSLTGESRPEPDETREALTKRHAKATSPDEPLAIPEFSVAAPDAHEPLEVARPPLAAPATPANPPNHPAKQSARNKSKASVPSRKGGAPSRAEHGSKAAAARASASTGAALNYASIVRARVASRRPPGQGQRGTVYITFGVSPSGGLTFANVSRSSGDPSLDRNVLAAVRSAAPFPAPPSGASLRQRQFSMPFHFQ